jgi:hypothetical protein
MIGAAVMGLLLAAGAQQGDPTVGDTIWLTRTVLVPAGRTLRPADWTPPDPVELLGPPQVSLRGDSAEVSYPVVVWRTGSDTVELPGPILLGSNGSVDSLPGQSITLHIKSVLPVVPPDSTLAPQPRADFVPRRTVSVLPLLVLGLIAGLLLAPLHWWWRRRGKERQVFSLPPPRGGEPPLERWADAGESRAVAAAATARLRWAIAEALPAAHVGLDTEDLLRVMHAARPPWPLGELGDLLRSLDEARFGERTFPDALGLARWAGELEPRLVREAA